MQQTFIFIRHGESLLNATKNHGQENRRVQGANIDGELSAKGELQATDFAKLLKEYLEKHSLRVATVYSSDAVRAIKTRDIVLAHAHIRAQCAKPDPRLREIHKGNLENVLYQDAYPDDATLHQKEADWHFRYGTPESGGETAYEAGMRWLTWFNEASKSTAEANEVTLVFGHNSVTACGLWLLLHPDSQPSDLTLANTLKVTNGQALVLTGRAKNWEASPLA
jgi:broad specificity phosphatase PhoE